MRAGVTLTGMMTVDSSLFNGIEVPDGASLSTLIDTIIFSYGDLYLDNTDIAWTKEAITVWGKRHKYYMDELWKTLFYSYNPIENYDRYETYTDKSTGKADTESESNTNNNVAAFDSPAMQPDSSASDTGSSSVNSSSETQHDAHIHGNIGVTTAAQMIQGQRDIINISWYDEIAKLFASEFLIMLY